MKISILRTIIKEEIASRLSEDQIKADFIKKLADELIDTINNWDGLVGEFDMEEAADVILMNADLPEGMSVDMRNDITTDDIITKATSIEFGMDEIVKEEIAGRLNEEEETTSNLEKFAIALKKSIDSNDRFTIRPIPPTRIDGKMYYGIEKDDPERFNQFKYGSYAVEEPWGIIANMLGLNFEDEEYGRDTHDTINKLMKSLRTKKLIDLEW